jgi:hypothetical protein
VSRPRAVEGEGRPGVLVPVGCAAGILAASAACFAGGIAALAAWRFSGDPAWIQQFFRLPGAFMMILLAAIQVWLSIWATRQFAPGEAMRSAWALITLSAACATAAAILVQFLSVPSVLNPLVRLSATPEPWLRECGTVGHLLGGPARFALLAVGLYGALRAYRRAGFLGRLRWPDVVVLAIFTAYLARNLVDVVAAHRAFGWAEVAGWPTDPLLLVLLVEGMLLRRSVQQMGRGRVGYCWTAFSLGVFLTAAGDVGGWAEAYGYLPYPWSAAVWFVWLPAAVCFAVAPAYQLEALRFAAEERA